jgi:beta-hydroxylase
VFYDSHQFEFTRPLEENYQAIYQEYLGIRAELIDWVETELYDQGWQVFGLFDFPHGRAIEENARRCPLTAELVEKYFGNHGAAGFSVLRPHTRINPHQGYQGDYLRCHLGLRIPAGDCALQVEDETRHWREGQVMVFDDRLWHRAWNNTDQERVILLVDFVWTK